MTPRYAAARKMAVAAALFLGLGATDALASHARFGTISWVAQNPAQPNVVTFRVETAWRRSFFSPLPTVGSTVNLGTTLNFGNGTSVSLTPTVTAINPAEDWFTAVFTTTRTYAATNASYVASSLLCCRISTLRDSNNDRDWRIATTVNINMTAPNRSPVSSSLPIITLARGVPNTFAFPAADPDGDPLTFRFATPGESGLFTAVPAGLTMTPAGVVTWTPTINGLYALQVIISDGRGASIALDVILNVVTATGTAPTITLNGSPSPITLFVSPGTPVSVTIVGTDPDIDPATGLANTFLTMNSGSRPSGSTMSTGLPFTARSPISATFNWTPAVSDGGAHVVVFSVTDNTGLQRSNSVTIDVEKNQPPTLVCPANVTAEAQSSAGRTVSLAVTVADPNPTDTVAVGYTIDAGSSVAWWTLAPIGATPQTRTDSFAFALGSHTIAFSASDGVAPAATCSSQVDIVDTTPPAITLPPSVTLEATGPAGAAHTFTASAVDVVDGVVPVTCVPASGSTFPLGSNNVTCSASDAAGNSHSAVFVVTVVDTTPPALALPPSVTLEATGPGGTVHTFTATATDLVSGSVPVSCAPPSGATFDFGPTTVACSATDAAGNTANGSFIVTVWDTTPPVLTLPPSVTIEATGPSGAVHTFTASATDLVNGSVPVACTPASGATFPLGATAVACSAADAFGNTATGSFTVTVVDTTPPVLSLPPDVTLEATGPSGAPHTFTASAADIVDGPVPVTCTPASGSTFPLGATVVACSATDAAGNAASGSFTVTVADTTPPVLTLPPDVILEATGPSGAPHTFTASAVDTVDGSVPVTCTPASGSTFPLGTTTVACSATDAAGNSASGSFSVSVVDTTPPSLSLPPSVTIEATSASGAVHSFTASAVDLVSGPVPVTCAPASGSTFALGTTTVACSATDAAGNAASGSFTVTVVDNTPPTIVSVTPDPGTLWPPNHKMVLITVAVVATDATSTPSCAVIGVSSNEPIDGGGDGDTAPDWELLGGLSVNLRSERAGGDSGRIYTVTVRCVDAAGNASIGTAAVGVPHDMSLKSKSK